MSFFFLLPKPWFYLLNVKTCQKTVFNVYVRSLSDGFLQASVYLRIYLYAYACECAFIYSFVCNMLSMDVDIHFSTSVCKVHLYVWTVPYIDANTLSAYHVPIYSGHGPGTHPLASHCPAQWEHLACPTTSQGVRELSSKGPRAGSPWLKVEPSGRCKSCSSAT